MLFLVLARIHGRLSQQWLNLDLKKKWEDGNTAKKRHRKAKSLSYLLVVLLLTANGIKNRHLLLVYKRARYTFRKCTSLVLKTWAKARRLDFNEISPDVFFDKQTVVLTLSVIVFT